MLYRNSHTDEGIIYYSSNTLLSILLFGFISVRCDCCSSNCTWWLSHWTWTPCINGQGPEYFCSTKIWRGKSKVNLSDSSFSLILSLSECIHLYQVKGVLEMLKTNMDTGVSGEHDELSSRKKAFGSNTYPVKKGRSFLVLIEVW